MPNSRPRCSALNSKGKPCNAPPIQPEGLCFGHHPKADEWRKKGGRPRSRKRAALPAPAPVSDLMDDSALSPLLRNMEEILAQLSRDDIQPDRARAMVTVTNAMMKIMDKTDDYPAPEPDPEPELSDDHPFSWMFNDPPAWFVEARQQAQAMVESHEERLASDLEYAEEWRIHEEERLRDEEDFYYAMTEAVKSLETVDRSQPPSDIRYENASQEAMHETFKQAVAEREAQRRQADPAPV